MTGPQNPEELDLTDTSKREYLASYQSGSQIGDVFEKDSAELAPPTQPRIRRRSELARVRKEDSPFNNDAFELAALPILLEDGPTKRHVERPQPLTTDSSNKADTLEDFQPVTYPPSISRIFETPTDAVSLSPTQKAYHNKRTWIYFGTCFWCFFLQGWNDGSTGPLLPRIQSHYNVGFTIVSLLFVLNCVGYVSGALTNVWLTERWGFGKLIVLGACLQTCSYVMMSPGGPFPLMVMGYCFAGFGMALQNAQGNGLISSFNDAPTKLGFLHAGYGLGAFVAPLIATQFSKMAVNWHFYYIISMGLSASNAISLYYVFGTKHQEEIVADSGQPVGEKNTLRDNVFKQIFRLPALHSLSIFAVIYVGIEVTIGGWIVTFIETKRAAGSNAGYISSGFFGGLMVGRVTLIWLNQKIGPRRVLFIYLLLAIQLEVTIWVVPSLIENAVAVAFIGLLLGPMYPIMLNHSTLILPKWLLTPSVGWIAGAGQAGSAVLPFLTGILASKFGITSLQPFIVSMMSTLLVLWAMVPRAATRLE